MKRFTLLASLALAFTSLTANADLIDKSFKTVDLSQASNFVAHGNNTVTAAASSVTILNTSTSGGRGYNTSWDESVYSNVTLPETGYTATVVFTLNATGDINKNDFELALIPTGVDMSAKTTGSYAPGTSSIFCLTQVYSPNATAPEGGSVLGTGHAACTVNGAKAATALSPTLDEANSANVDIAAGTQYTLRVNIIGTTAKWSITAADGTVTGSGEYTIGTESTHVGALYGVLSRGNSSSIKIEEISLSYKYDGYIANNPVCTLGDIVQNTERDYQVKFQEGEILHWIKPLSAAEKADGTQAEGSVSYAESYDLLNDKTGTGVHTIDVYADGALQMWTTNAKDENAKSEVVTKEVALDWNICPTPVLTITKVADGSYAKTYRVTADNSSMELPKTVFLYYTYTPEGGTPGARTAINSGSTFEVPGKGSVLVECTTGLQDYGEQKINYSQDTQVTIQNSVEYETKLVVDYNKWTTAQVEATGLFNARNTAFRIGADTNGGHWANSFASENAKYDYDTYNKRTTTLQSASDYSAVVATSVWCYDAKDSISASKAFLPIIPTYSDCTADMSAEGGWAWLLDEGVVVDEITTPNAKGFIIDPQWLSDDEANKPNLVEIVYTGSYDKYNQQYDYDSTDPASCHHIAFATTAAPSAAAKDMSISSNGLNLYRYDTSINRVAIHTYKGFVPGSGTAIQNVTADKTAATSIRKMITKNGIVIVKGNNTYSVAGAQIK